MKKKQNNIATYLETNKKKSLKKYQSNNFLKNIGFPLGNHKNNKHSKKK